MAGEDSEGGMGRPRLGLASGILWLRDVGTTQRRGQPCVASQGGVGTRGETGAGRGGGLEAQSEPRGPIHTRGGDGVLVQR